MKPHEIIFEGLSIRDRLALEEQIIKTSRALLEFSSILEWDRKPTLGRRRNADDVAIPDSPSGAPRSRPSPAGDPKKASKKPDLGRKYNLTTDEVDKLFAAIEQAAGRTVAGHGVDAVKKASSALANLGAALMNSGPVRAFDTAYDNLILKIKNLLENGEFTTLNYSSDRDGDSSSLLVRLTGHYKDFAKKHPVLQKFFITALMVIAAMLTGGAGGVAVAGAIKTIDKLLQGEKLSKALAIGILYTAAGLGAKYALSELLNIPVDPNAAKNAATNVVNAPGLADSAQTVASLRTPKLREIYDLMFAAAREHGAKGFSYYNDAGDLVVSGTRYVGEPFSAAESKELIALAKQGKLLSFGKLSNLMADIAQQPQVSWAGVRENRNNKKPIITESTQNRVIVTETRQYVKLTESEVDLVFEGIFDWFRKKNEPISLGLNKPAPAASAASAAPAAPAAPAADPEPKKPSMFQRAKTGISKLGAKLTNKISKDELHKSWQQYKQENGLSAKRNSSDVLYAMLAAYKPEVLDTVTIQRIYRQLGLPTPNQFGAGYGGRLRDERGRYVESTELSRIMDLSGIRKIR